MFYVSKASVRSINIGFLSHSSLAAARRLGCCHLLLIITYPPAGSRSISGGSPNPNYPRTRTNLCVCSQPARPPHFRTDRGELLVNKQPPPPPPQCANISRKRVYSSKCHSHARRRRRRQRRPLILCGNSWRLAVCAMLKHYRTPFAA